MCIYFTALLDLPFSSLLTSWCHASLLLFFSGILFFLVVLSAAVATSLHYPSFPKASFSWSFQTIIVVTLSNRVLYYPLPLKIIFQDSLYFHFGKRPLGNMMLNSLHSNAAFSHYNSQAIHHKCMFECLWGTGDLFSYLNLPCRCCCLVKSKTA